MEPYFTRISCWIEYKDLPPVIEKEYLGFYESSWDVRTNLFIKNNLEKINTALKTYPSEYCYYEMHYVPQPATIEFVPDLEKWKEMEEIAEEQREETDEKLGVIYCSLFQDRGHENPRIQRVLIFNVEDNTPQAILAAIRYMAQFADKMKNEVRYGSGIIPHRYDRPWKVDLAIDQKELYDSAFGWLEMKNEMYFSQTLLEYDEESHRLWFVDNHGKKDKEFIPHDLLAQAFYILVWNHPEGIKDYDLCVSPADKPGLVREKELKEEFVRYYKFLNPQKDQQNMDPEFYEKKINNFCEFVNRSARDTARSRIKNAFKRHESERVNEYYAAKVAEYYAFDATDGIIKVKNRSTTIILPDYLMSDRLKKYNAEQADNADKQS